MQIQMKQRKVSIIILTALVTTVAQKSGNPGTTKQDTEGLENNFTCYASPTDGEMNIIHKCCPAHETRSYYH